MLAHYKIISLIGEGGMGVVYEAEDTRLKRRVALKILSDKVARDSRLLERFQREAEALATLNHPNIVTVYSVETADGIPFLTMELVAGRRLDELIPRNGMDVGAFFDLALPLTEALCAAHETGITHRDLKPANIVVAHDGRLKVLDFGLAKLEQELPGGEQTMDLERPLTEAGSIVGTAPYMSPEQLEGKAVDARSDIFSLGILMYEMLTGERPFKGDSSMAVMSSVLKDQPRQMTELKANLPRHLERIVAGCLEKNPDDRHPNSVAVRNNLRQLQRELATESQVQSAVQPALRPASGSRKRLLPIGLVIVAVAVVGYFATRPATGGSRRSTPLNADVAVTAAGDERKMIVVLPFENLGTSDDEYFADGLTEEITSRLAAIKSLGVISRTSAMQYKGKRPSLQEIGEQLGVAYVLEGTVRWQRTADGPSRIRVTPQLIRVADDTHLWSSRYDKELAEIFAVQSEIAATVARELNVTLGEPEKQAVAAIPTDNMEAYQAYLRAMEIWHRPGYNVENFRLSWQLLERAIELDPEFVPAMAAASNVYSMLYVGGDAPASILDQARKHLEEARRLEPANPKVLLAWGYYYYLAFFDYDRALAELRAAEKLAPNDFEVAEAMAYVFRRQGNLALAMEKLRQAIALDPQNAHLQLQYARSLSADLQHAEADASFERSIKLAPDSDEAYLGKALNLFAWKGDFAETRAVLDRFPVQDTLRMIVIRSTLDLWERRYAEGLERLTRSDIGSVEDISIRLQYLELTGRLLQLEGRAEDARKAYVTAMESVRALIEAQPTQSHPYTFAALFQLRLGEIEAAGANLEKARELGRKDRFFVGTIYFVEIEYAIRTGDLDRAVALARTARDTPNFMRLSRNELRVNLLFDPIRDHPGFRELLED